MQQAFIRVLIINEDRQQYLHMVNVLQAVQGVDYELTWCAQYRHALEAMLTPMHDVILLDFEHNPESCHELLRAAAAHDCSTPIICLTPAIDRQLDRSVIKAGAADYLLKQQLTAESLERAMRYAIDRKHSEAELARLAHYDLLTGIPNRLLFNDRLDRALQRAKRGDEPFSLLYIDLDGFKAINDTHGHDKGDLLVQGIAQRLSQCIRRTDSVARIGGDEFTVLLEKAGSTNDTVSIAQKIIEVVTEPFDIGGQHVRVGCSIGIAVYPDAGRDAQTLLRHADMAMYEAKGIAGSNYRFFTDKMNVEAVDQNRLEAELRKAINEDQFGLYFQPRISIRTGKVVGAEALLRWQHPERELLLPGEFIDLAEHAGLLPAMGYWVLNQLCSCMIKMNQQRIPPLRISLNVSVSQFREADFVEGVQKILANHQIDAERFEFELA
ncbi:MAG: diguanylate cyclase, partial [Pseudomonadales bacterium]|nr:diguanylate cyclase [Pseudomonadales bacterium]